MNPLPYNSDNSFKAHSHVRQVVASLKAILNHLIQFQKQVDELYFYKILENHLYLLKF